MSYQSSLLPLYRRRRAVGGFSPLSLFASGEQGGWYDPSDLTTMFQDAAGTTAAALESPVGLVLDKSKGAVGTNGAKRVNLLSWTEAFDNAAWTRSRINAFGSGSVANTTATLDPIGGNTADFIQEDTSASNTHVIAQNVTVASAEYIVSVYAKAAGRNWIALAGPWTNAGVWFDLANGAVGTKQAGVASASITDVGNGWYLCSLRGTASSSSLLNHAIFLANADNSVSYTGNGSAGVYIWGAGIRLASEASTAPTPYQRITADWASTMSGNHLSQSTSTARPVLSARVNEFLHTEDISNAYWTKGELNTSGTPAWVNVATAPNGTTTADAIIPNTTNTYHGFSRTAITVQNTTIRFSVRVKANGYNYVALQFANAGTFAKYFEGVFNLTNGTVENTGRAVTYTGTRNTPVALGDGWYEVSITVNSVDANSTSVAQVIVQSTNDPTASFAGDGTKGILVWGADLRPSNAGVGLPAYQRVGAATDYDATGFPYYLKFDGTDDFLVSGTISPGSVDKAQVFAGVRKLNDVFSVIGELSAMVNDNNGSMGFGSYSGYWLGSRGTVYADALLASAAAPRTSVLSGALNISGDSAVLRVNGSDAATGTGDQGSGNYASNMFYVGRRAGLTDPFSGHLYSLILRFSATNMDAATIASTETWVNQRTKAY